MSNLINLFGMSFTKFNKIPTAHIMRSSIKAYKAQPVDEEVLEAMLQYTLDSLNDAKTKRSGHCNIRSYDANDATRLKYAMLMEAKGFKIEHLGTYWITIRWSDDD